MPQSAAWDWDAIASRYSCSGGTADEYLTPQVPSLWPAWIRSQAPAARCACT